MQLGITTVQRDRAPWIKEWVAFHYLVGFRKFYIFLHNCQDDTGDVLDGLKKHFDIKTFIRNSDMNIPEKESYQYSCDNFLKDVDWMAFIDGDEFLFPVADDAMESALAKFNDKNLSALGIYWRCFGSSGYVAEPAGLIIENYRQRAPDHYHNNRHIKSIVRGGQTGVYHIDSHLFKTPLGTYDENLRFVTGGGLTGYDPTYNIFCVNHYILQSRSHFLKFKAPSEYSCFDGVIEERSEDWWEEHNRNDVLDNSMDRFIGPLKKILGSI